MERVIHDTVDPDANGSGLAGFRDRNPGVAPATIVPFKWLNEVQEEIVRSITGAGLALASGWGQLWQAIQRSTPYARYDLSGTNVANDGKVTLTQILASSGFSVASDEITFPTAGVYEVSVAVTCRSDGTSNPEPIFFDLNTFDGVSGGDTLRLTTTRHSATAADEVMVSATALISVGSVANERLSLINRTGATVDIVNTTSKIATISIRRLFLEV